MQNHHSVPKTIIKPLSLGNGQQASSAIIPVRGQIPMRHPWAVKNLMPLANWKAFPAKVASHTEAAVLRVTSTWQTPGPSVPHSAQWSSFTRKTNPNSQIQAVGQRGHQEGTSCEPEHTHTHCTCKQVKEPEKALGFCCCCCCCCFVFKSLSNEKAYQTGRNC